MIAHGDFALAWQYNPATFLVMTFGILATIRALVCVTAHRWINTTWHFYRIVYALMAVALVTFWLYQQQNAEFIINSGA